jgi:hypothetical protein
MLQLILDEKYQYGNVRPLSRKTIMINGEIIHESESAVCE